MLLQKIADKGKVTDTDTVKELDGEEGDVGED